MKKCVIFCAGEFTELTRPIGADETVIAADGGLLHTQAIGLTPDIILGDFDSLGAVPPGAVVFPIEKDDTDSMLAIKQGLALGCDRFYLYGALGGKRLDHTVANLQALHYLADQGARGWLIGRREIVTTVRDGAIELPPSCIGYLSVFCLGSDAEGVSIRGAKYELEDATLSAGFPLGVSNQFIQKKVTVSVRRGTLLLIWRRCNGIW